MGNPETKILRDENARNIGIIKKLEHTISQVTEGYESTIAELRGEVAELKGKLAYYENPYSSPSANSIKTRQKKAQRAKNTQTQNKGGRKAGHEGVSHQRKPTRTISYTPDKCEKCGSKNITKTKTTTKMTTDIPNIPKLETVNNIIHECTCQCGHTTTPKVGIKNTSIGPNLMTFITSSYKHHASLNSIRFMLKELGVVLCKKTIQDALFATSNALGPEVESMFENSGKSKFWKLDETTYIIFNKRGYVWVCVTDDSVLIHVDRSRSAIVLDLHFPHFKIPVTVDGYAGYNRFKDIQRCWSHILLDAEYAQEENKTKILLYEKLQLLFHNAKQIASKPDAHKHYDSFVSQCMAYAEEYKKTESKFGTTLQKAAPNLFTFLKHPEMDPINNESERMLRKVVISRKIRQRLVNDVGMKAFGILMSCFLTWDKRGTSIREEILKLY